MHNCRKFEKVTLSILFMKCVNDLQKLLHNLIQKPTKKKKKAQKEVQ